MDNNKLKDILAYLVASLIVILLIGGLFFVYNFLLTKILICVIKGLFEIDYSDKFWYIFVLTIILSAFLRPSINIDAGKGKTPWLSKTKWYNDDMR